MVTAAVVPAVVPSPQAGVARAGSRQPARPLPVPDLPTRAAGDTVYGIAVLDRYGRLADRAVLHALGWGPGHPVALTLLGGSVLAVPDPPSPVRIGSDGYLRLPVGVRRARALHPGDRVLLVAEPFARRLLLHPPAALDALLDAHHALLLRGATR